MGTQTILILLSLAVLSSAALGNHLTLDLKPVSGSDCEEFGAWHQNEEGALFVKFEKALMNRTSNHRLSCRYEAKVEIPEGMKLAKGSKWTSTASAFLERRNDGFFAKARVGINQLDRSKNDSVLMMADGEEHFESVLSGSFPNLSACEGPRELLIDVTLVSRLNYELGGESNPNFKWLDMTIDPLLLETCDSEGE